MDLILINGKVHTMDMLNKITEAVAIKNGKVVKTGTSSEIFALKTNITEIIDLKGKVILPGFNDSHMHLLNFANSLSMIDLNSCSSIEELIERVKTFINAKNLVKNKWIRGKGWNQDYFKKEKRFPTKYDLDKISTEYPIVITRACIHICVVNSKALALLGITKETPQVEGGQFDIDKNGEPIGIFREKALSLVYDKIPSPTSEELKNMIKEATYYANSKGLTSIQSDDFTSIPGVDYIQVINAYNELKESGNLTLRVNEQCLLPAKDKLEKFLKEGFTTGQGDEFFKIGPLKLLVDGSLGARTAALCKPYFDDPSTSGILVYDQKELNELILTAHNSGMQIAVHCIGDKAMYMTFEAFQKALKVNPKKNHRHSIVHCQITDEILLNKFKELDIIAHIQPIFIHYDLHMVEDRIGRERMKSSYAFKTMIQKGIHIALGTDCPVEALDVMPSIYCAVTRKDLNGYPEKGWMPEERLSIEEAVYNYTMGSAYASFEDTIKGSIEEGKLADMVVLSEDIFEVDKDRIKDLEVEMTLLGGKVIYKK
ncbi:amidohydrolase [Clostridium sp. PL3]|uniref:Amidohydrolase n=1 Tax=Clostridium thailandense TaxID=2794346 RepID=A0A949TSL7_9CLOT|nr:amidohydrolase [Clostridium thailandense]MBV7274617.1 amidohydrolase [Clostridium thailandense]